jgi:hypothetical protein
MPPTKNYVSTYIDLSNILDIEGVMEENGRPGSKHVSSNIGDIS